VRDDFLHAQASVDWAVSHFLDMDRRIKDWLTVNAHIAIEELQCVRALPFARGDGRWRPRNV